MTPKNKLNIVFVIDDSLDRDDGVQQYVKSLGAYYHTLGHRVSYFCGQTKSSTLNGGKVYSLSKNINVKFNGNRLSIPLPAGKNGIKLALKEAKPDILHIQVPYSPLMAGRVIKMAGEAVKLVGTFHILPAGRLQSLGSRLLKIWYKKQLYRFNYIFSVSRPAKTFAKTVFKLDSEVMPNVVDLGKFANKQSENAKRIVFLGRLVERKGPKHLISACVILKKSIPDFELLIAGDGPKRSELENLVQISGLEDNTRFLGYIDEKDKPALLGSARIACFPSLYGESFGIVLIEAMAAGAKVTLGGNNPGYASVLAPKPELLFDPLNEPALAQKLQDYLTDTQKADKIAGWQKQYVKLFAVESVGKKLIERYLN